VAAGWRRAGRSIGADRSAQKRRLQLPVAAPRDLESQGLDARPTAGSLTRTCPSTIDEYVFRHNAATPRCDKSDGAEKGDRDRRDRGEGHVVADLIEGLAREQPDEAHERRQDREHRGDHPDDGEDLRDPGREAGARVAVTTASSVQRGAAMFVDSTYSPCPNAGQISRSWVREGSPRLPDGMRTQPSQPASRRACPRSRFRASERHSGGRTRDVCFRPTGAASAGWPVAIASRRKESRGQCGRRLLLLVPCGRPPGCVGDQRIPAGAGAKSPRCEESGYPFAANGSGCPWSWSGGDAPTLGRLVSSRKHGG